MDEGYSTIGVTLTIITYTVLLSVAPATADPVIVRYPEET